MNPLDLIIWVAAVGGAIVIAALAAAVVIGVIKGALNDKKKGSPRHAFRFGDKSS